MERRGFLKILGMGALSAGLAKVASSEEKEAPPEKQDSAWDDHHEAMAAKTAVIKLNDERSMSKTQIHRGLGLLIDKAGQAYEADPTVENRNRLNEYGLSAGMFGLTGEIRSSLRAEVHRALQEQ